MDRKKRAIDFESEMDKLGPLSARVANEDLADLFVDYYDTQLRHRSLRYDNCNMFESFDYCCNHSPYGFGKRYRRSIHAFSRDKDELDMLQPLEVSFPNADRSTKEERSQFEFN